MYQLGQSPQARGLGYNPLFPKNVPFSLLAIYQLTWAKVLRNFYLITDAQARTCDYCFHVKWEVSWMSSLLNYRPKRVKLEGKGQLNWQVAKLDMFGKNENECLWTLRSKLGRDSTFFWALFLRVTHHYVHWQSRWSRLFRVGRTAEMLTWTRVFPAHTYALVRNLNTLKMTLCASRVGVAGQRSWTRWGSSRLQL